MISYRISISQMHIQEHRYTHTHVYIYKKMSERKVPNVNKDYFITAQLLDDFYFLPCTSLFYTFSFAIVYLFYNQEK